MATNTTRSFNEMLNEHLDYDLLKAEMEKRTWLLNNCAMDDGWKGGIIPVPFKGAQASSVRWGGLVDAASVGQSTYKRGTISAYKEVWGSLRINHTDLIQHDGKVNEDSFLKLWPDELEDFLVHIKNKVSTQLLNGHAAKFSANGDASGNVTTLHPERFTIGEFLYFGDDNSADLSGYVRTIDMNTGVMVIYSAVTGGSVVDLSGMTVAQNAKVYYDGTTPTLGNGFTSLRSQLLSAANGGSTSIFGIVKTAYPYTQALNLDGSTFTEDNILEGLFNRYVTVRNRCGGRPTKAVMSYQNGAAIMKNLEVAKGAYHIDQKGSQVTAYGWEEIAVLGPKGRLTLVLVQEMEDDVIFILDPKTIKFHSNGMFKERVAPDGKKFFEVRGTDGFYYIVDIMCFGELACFMPTANAVIANINFQLSEV